MPSSPNCRETTDELLERDESFTQLISFLFKTLEQLEGRAKRSGRIVLILYTPTQKLEGCYHRRFSSWRVHFLKPEALPRINCVRHLSIELSSGSPSFYGLSCGRPSRLRPDRRILVDLAMKLPNLERLKCELDADAWSNDEDSEVVRHYTRDWEGLRRDDRQDFSRALTCAQNLLPGSLKDIKLDFVQMSIEFQLVDQRKQLPDLVSPAL